VQSEARAVRADVIPAEKFAENFLTKHNDAAGDDKADPGSVEEISLSPDELNSWMELFNPYKNKPEE
jgi:hypothetical protein